MTDDIVTRLRAWQIDGVQTIYDEAADEIERLRGLIDPVVKAFVIQGRVPEYHEYIKGGLKKDWPTLYKSIERLVNEY